MKKRKLKGVIIMASKIDELRKLHADKMLDADELDNIAGGDLRAVRRRQPVPERAATGPSGAAGPVRRV